MRIFVGGLPQTATKDDVVRLFRQFGADDAGVVLPRDRRTRRRKGFAYVEIADPERARAAIGVFAGFTIDGKALTVCAAEDRPLKRRQPKLVVAFLMVAAASGAYAPAWSDELSTEIGLTLNPIVGGVHESFNDLTHVPPVPIPLAELRGRYGPFEVDLEGLPPVASVRSYDPIEGHTSTVLSLFEGIARVWDPLHRFSAGIGQTLYNQSTHYSDPLDIVGTSETQFSRVTGVMYQAGYDVPYHRGHFEAVFNFAPAMLGTQFTIFDIAHYAPRIDPERAEQIDTAVRYTHPVGRHGEMMLGLRYINYTARYDEPSGGLSDRNVGLLPVIGYRTRIGR
jgi:hypothetical protein